jgi:glyoxylase-like metal-dependent hydrolase (beta-lactamase superfamily II)
VPEGRLAAVTLAYLPQNQRARITELGTAESAPAPSIGALGALAATSAPAAAPRIHQTVLKLRWKVENPDGDELNYRLAFRQENDAVWRPLGGPDPLTKTEFDWNTEGLPDGTYVVKLTASDERSVPRELALDTTFTSSPILVDNRKPEVTGLAVKYPYVSGRARDDQSPIAAMEYSIDGGDWQILAAADGICDDVVESFSIKLPSLPAGPHAVAIRAWDSADNVGAASISIRSPEMTGPSFHDAAGLPPAPEVVQIEVGLLQNFCEILYCPETHVAAIVDPAWEVDRLLRETERLGLKVELALITHTHNDHIEGVDELVEKTGAVVVVNPREAAAVSAPGRALIDATDGRDIAIGRRGLRALETRGHTVGGTCYLADGYIVTGDVLFVGGLRPHRFHGRRHRGHVAQPPAPDAAARGDARLPRHNYGETQTSTIGHETRTNPFLRCATFEEFRALRERKRKA